MVAGQIIAAPGGDPLMITLQTDAGQIVSTEVHMNAADGYHVHAQLVGRAGTVEMAPLASTPRGISLGKSRSWPAPPCISRRAMPALTRSTPAWPQPCMPATELKSRLADAGLRLASVNALQRFNDWTGARARGAKPDLLCHRPWHAGRGAVPCAFAGG